MNTIRKRSLEEEKASAEKKKQKSSKDAGTQPQRVYYGLINQGATCYLNSVLQVLFMTTEIHNRLDPKSEITDQELRNIFQKLKKTTCGTENITKRLEIKNVNQQRDAAEFLEFILHKVSPQVSNAFLGQLTYMTKCSEKKHIINEETNPFWTLPLSLKDAHDTNYDVERGFERIFDKKTFSGDNMVYCNDCEKKTKASSECEMVESPQILILLLKRFDFDYNTMSHVKSDCCVDVPRTLQRKDKKYKLYGMVNHYGSLRGGHYTATILCNEDKTWYEFDDARVTQAKEQPFAKSTTYKSSTAYLLVYRGSLRDKVEERQDETAHLDEQRGYKVKYKRNFDKREADDKETRQNQESHEQKRKERKKEAFSHQGQREEGGRGVNEPIIKESFLLQKQNTSNSSTQHPDSWTKTEKRKPRSKGDEDEKSPQPCSSTNITKNPLLIPLIVVGCVLIVILIVVLTTLI